MRSVKRVVAVIALAPPLAACTSFKAELILCVVLTGRSKPPRNVRLTDCHGQRW